MLRKINRLTRKDFSEVAWSRVNLSTPHFVLRLGERKGEAQFSLTVSKKVAKSAPARNTLRRRAYSILREEKNILPKLVYIFKAKTGADKLRGEKLKQEILELLKLARRG